ncbi:MAG TPA: hypothetical protein DGH68_03670 [Bacteroidetes bacterium]|nr:hypothetical protein [Bacteroidota bacterium]
MTKTLRIGIYGAIATLIGIILSGPLALVLVNLVHPQPAWMDAQTFVNNFHAVQTLPFFGGIALVIGYVVLMAALHHLADDGQKTTSLIAVILTAAFATLIFFNYISQTTFVPALAREYKPEYESLIAAFSFSNPNSLCWAIEMWGYALLGLATWFAAPVFNRNTLEKVTAALMIANGVISIIGAIIASQDLAWVFTVSGFVSYAVWNVLVLALSTCIIVSLRKRLNKKAVTG